MKFLKCGFLAKYGELKNGLIWLRFFVNISFLCIFSYFQLHRFYFQFFIFLQVKVGQADFNFKWSIPKSIQSYRCSIWLAVDVWMCTASILHLVVISLDRYIAVTHPITYPNLMTSKKAKMLIAGKKCFFAAVLRYFWKFIISGAWILSFVICFPPLVGWNDKNEDSSYAFDLNKTQGKWINQNIGKIFENIVTLQWLL